MFKLDANSRFEDYAEEKSKLLDGFGGDRYLVRMVGNTLHSLHSGTIFSDSTKEHLRRSLNTEVSRVNMKNGVEDVMHIHVAEALLWMKHSGVSYIQSALDDKMVTQEALDRLDFLEAVISYPEGRPYFLAGMTDLAEVERCVANGIDAELAETVFSAQG